MILGSFDVEVNSPYHFAAMDDRFGNSIDRPNAVCGRRPNPAREDEVLVNRAMADVLNVEVGDTLNWLAFTAEEVEGEIDPADGRKVHLKIVGIGTYPNEVVPTAQYDASPFLYLTPAYSDAHSYENAGFNFEVIRLRNGAADVAEFRTAMSQLMRDYGAHPGDGFFADRTQPYEQVRRAIHPS